MKEVSKDEQSAKHNCTCMHGEINSEFVMINNFEVGAVRILKFVTISLQVIGTFSHWKLNVPILRMAVSGWVSYDMWTNTSTPVAMSSLNALMSVCVMKRHHSFVKTSKSTLRTSVHVVSTAVPTARRMVSIKISLDRTLCSVPRWSLSVLMLLTARQHFQEKTNTPISPPASIRT